MGWFITEKLDYLTKLPLAAIGLLLFGLAPIIFSVTFGALLEWITGYAHDESNSAVVASGWFVLLTAPAAALGALVLVIVVVRDTIVLYLN